MKKILLWLIVALPALWLSGCRAVEDDYYTQAVVTLQVPDTVVPLKMQGTLVMRNLSTGRRYSSSTFEGTTLRLELMRGPYMLDAEGTLLYRLRDGSTKVSYFRASNNYVEAVDHPTVVRTKIIFM